MTFSWNRNTSHCRDASLIEFALVLPVLIALVFGIIEASIVLYDKAVITNASREAARAGVRMGKTRPTEAEIAQVAINYCGNRLISFRATSAPPAVAVERPATPVTSDPLKVSVSYQYQGFSMGKLYNAFAGPINLSATTVMAYE